MAVTAQQAFAEAAIFDPATGNISIYHPLVSNAGTPPAAAPIVPSLPAGAVVGLWFGFNGGTLTLHDENGQDSNNSPSLKSIDCVNGLPGTEGDVFGQVSWCNAETWFTAANKAVSAGQLVIPDLGADKLGNPCPTSRSFEITDACPSDNVPTQYLLKGTATAQDTAANKDAVDGEVINNASDEALLTNIIDPLIGCTPFLAPSVDDPGSMVPALALSELQAAAKQAAPIGFVPLNDPDTLLTATGAVSVDKTNAYRLGVNQPVVGSGVDAGDLVSYCQAMVEVGPPFFKGFEDVFLGQPTADAAVGNNLFTFMCERYLMSLTQLTCPQSAIPVQPVVCQTNGAGVATSCTITLSGNSTDSTGGKTNPDSTTSSTSTSVSSSVSSTKTASGKNNGGSGSNNGSGKNNGGSGNTDTARETTSTALESTSTASGTANSATVSHSSALGKGGGGAKEVGQPTSYCTSSCSIKTVTVTRSSAASGVASPTAEFQQTKAHKKGRSMRGY